MIQLVNEKRKEKKTVAAVHVRKNSLIQVDYRQYTKETQFSSISRLRSYWTTLQYKTKH